MAWRINYTYDDGKEMVNIYGPSSISDKDLAALKDGKGYPFKMYCDDGELMASGKSLDSDSEEAFGPLDDWGEPSLGCTTIAYRPKGGGPFETL
tara:strand:+ start:320 stop:601 length:282 start_codon:yes stop_codon:yes gene_type:complete